MKATPQSAPAQQHKTAEGGESAFSEAPLFATDSDQIQQLMAMQSAANNSPQVQQLMSLQRAVSSSPQVLQTKGSLPPAKNNTGMPDDLKSGMENLSGQSMDDVNVHYNSDQPAQMQAHAFAQGSDIHIAPGQEQHLPHEAWHVVQQKQGRVQPTKQLKGKVSINDDAGLEQEADEMGAKALQMKAAPAEPLQDAKAVSGKMAVQRVVNENLVNVTAVTAITAEVFSVTHDGGDIIVKFKGDLGADSIADDALRSLGVSAPESKLVSADAMLARLPAKGEGPGATEALRVKLLSKAGEQVMVAEKLVGEALGPNATTPSNNTLAILDHPQFAFDLGKVAAFDVFLGHQDRILGGFNFGNMMQPNKNGLPQIDNQIQDNALYLDQVLVPNAFFDSIVAGEEAKFATKIQKLMKGAYDKDLDVPQFQMGFIRGIEHIQRQSLNMAAFLNGKVGAEFNLLRQNAANFDGAVDMGRCLLAKLALQEAQANLKEEIEAAKKAESAKKGGGFFSKFF